LLSDLARRLIAGPPLTLRLVISQIHDEQGRLLAVWFLLSNVPTDISAATLAVWYYWRWGIELFFKLIKSRGQQLEFWLQETGLKIAKHLLVASMACATVWQLQHEQSPAARQFEQVLVTISGRQMKWNKPVTTPALLAGLQMLLFVLNVLDDYFPDQLRRMLKQAMPLLAGTG